jgi:hypothetical protein
MCLVSGASRPAVRRHTASCSKGSGGPYPWGKADPSASNAEVKNEQSLSSTPPCLPERWNIWIFAPLYSINTGCVHRMQITYLRIQNWHTMCAVRYKTWNELGQVFWRAQWGREGDRNGNRGLSCAVGGKVKRVGNRGLACAVREGRW